MQRNIVISTRQNLMKIQIDYNWEGCEGSVSDSMQDW